MRNARNRGQQLEANAPLPLALLDALHVSGLAEKGVDANGKRGDCGRPSGIWIIRSSNSKRGGSRTPHHIPVKDLPESNGCGYFRTTANQRTISCLGCFDLPVAMV
jgi:hypothetical protein